MSAPIPLDATLDEAVAEAFEGMAFAVAERTADGVLGWERTDLCWARIPALDPQVGEVTLVLPPTLAREVADAILGGIAPVPDDKLSTVVAELLNTIAGAWLTRLKPDGGAVALGLPDHGQGAWGADRGPHELAVYEVDEVPFGLAVLRSPDG